MSDYFSELGEAMFQLSQNPKTRFIGQSVVYDGHSLFKSMTRVPTEKRLELPVFEDMQFGMSIGLALEGWVPVSIFPRMDFLIIAANQITNHLANLRIVSDGKYKARIITRVCVGAITPLHPGPQHCQNHTEALKLLCRDEIEVVELKHKNQIGREYSKALYREDSKPTILVEYGDLYHKE